MLSHFKFQKKINYWNHFAVVCHYFPWWSMCNNWRDELWIDRLFSRQVVNIIKFANCSVIWMWCPNLCTNSYVHAYSRYIYSLNFHNLIALALLTIFFLCLFHTSWDEVHKLHSFLSCLRSTINMITYYTTLCQWLGRSTMVKFTQLCSKFPLAALLNFACDWLALDRDISFGQLTSPNVWCYIPVES